MTHIQYIDDWNPHQKTLDRISAANFIIDEFSADGYVLTLRQLFYQMVGRGWIRNTTREYENLGATVTKAREAGMISWDAIEDRNRSKVDYLVQESDQAALDNLHTRVQFDLWDRQDTYIECWVEKEALAGVIQKACAPYRVPHLACKGYLSASEAWRAAQRFDEHAQNGQSCAILHLGDHDPSGIDMTRDNNDRVSFYGFESCNNVHVERLALNYDQVEEQRPPPNPAKSSDSRLKKYRDRFGSVSWELDALKPGYIVELIQANIEPYIDFDRWYETLEQEDHEKDVLKRLAEDWQNIRGNYEDA